MAIVCGLSTTPWRTFLQLLSELPEWFELDPKATQAHTVLTQAIELVVQYGPNYRKKLQRIVVRRAGEAICAGGAGATVAPRSACFRCHRRICMNIGSVMHEYR